MTYIPEVKKQLERFLMKRPALGQRVFIAPEFRIGWEPLVRATVNIGYAFGRK